MPTGSRMYIDANAASKLNVVRKKLSDWKPEGSASARHQRAAHANPNVCQKFGKVKKHAPDPHSPPHSFRSILLSFQRDRLAATRVLTRSTNAWQ